MRERAERHDAPRAAVVCPFKGLASFDVADAAFFFGRERLVAEMVARLVGAPLLGVVGPSGSGKSSVVRAGLLPELASGVLPGSEALDAGRAAPRRAPDARCCAAGDSPRPRRGSACWSPSTSSRRRSRSAATRPSARRSSTRSSPRPRDRSRRRVVVLAVRADFYGRCGEDPALAALLGANHVLVGPMRRGRAAPRDRAPAQRAGLARRAGARRCAARRFDGRARGAPAAVDRAARAVAAPRRQPPAAGRLRAHGRGAWARSARLAETAYGASTASSRRSRDGSSCAWPATKASARRAPARAAAELEADRDDVAACWTC